MREYFKNLPDKTTPLSADRINGLFNGEESIEKLVVGDISCKNVFNINSGTIETYNATPSVSNNTLNLTCTGGWALIRYKRVPVELGKSYTLSFNISNPSGNVVGVDVRKTDGTTVIGAVTRITDTAVFRQITFVAEESEVIIVFCANDTSNANTNTVVFSNIQLEKGSTITPYSPYKKYGYNSQESMGKIIVDDISCKNKLNLSMRTIGVRTNGTSVADAFEDLSTDSEIKIKPLSLGAFFPFQLVINNLKKNTNYTLSSTFIGTWQIYVYTDKLYGNVLFSQPLRGSNTFNTGDNTSIVLGFYSYNNPIDATYSISNILLEEGSIPTEYTPYKNFEGREDVITGQECPTNRYVDGKRVYVKRINVGSLPNSSNITFATGIPSDYNIDDTTARAIGTDDAKSFLKMPFSTGIVYSVWIRNGAYVLEVATTDDRSLLNGIFDFYYTKD